jgi:biopolymer transport protein ExbB
MSADILSELSPAAWTILASLALASVLATTIALAKIIQFAGRGVGRRREAENAIALWLRGDQAAALAAANERDGARLRVLRVLMGALAGQPKDTDRARSLATLTAVEELARLSRHLRGIEAVVQAAPMLGLLGTVIGMIEAFGRIAQTTGTADPALLAGGIWTALITTAIGLAIAIIFYFVHIWLETRVTREREALESLLGRVLAESQTLSTVAHGGQDRRYHG